MNFERLLPIIFTLLFCYNIFAETGRYRLMFNENPATEIIIGFDTYGFSTNTPILYYSADYINMSNLNVYDNITTYTTNSNYGMYNHFAKLTNLIPNTTYYFMLVQNGIFSDVYNFKTLPDDNTKLSIISAGDTQNQSQLCKTAFEMFSKLNPNFVLFQGDFTKEATDTQWQKWFDDWQFSITENNRIIPIIATRGNLENSNTVLKDLFNSPNTVYGAHTFGENLLKVYTLNSEISIYGSQTNWLLNDLNNESEAIWKLAHYHTAMRPHSLFKREGGRQYANWASLFNKYNVNVVIEGEGQNVKTTWPVKPCTGGFNCDEGFVRTDFGGTVYLGEGTLDCPLRYDADPKEWTRSNATFNQFKWLFVDTNKIEARTVVFDETTDVDAIDQLTDSNRYIIPQSLNIWNSNGQDFIICDKDSLIAKCEIIEPLNNSYVHQKGNCVTIIANAVSINGISKIDFFANDVFLGSSNAAPYVLSWYPPTTGNHIISAIATENNGNSSNTAVSSIFISNEDPIFVQSPIDINCEELFENNFGIVYDKNFQVKVTDNSGTVQGLQFTDLNIPLRAKILSANIQFSAASSNSLSATSYIKCEKNTDIQPFTKERKNISKRPVTDNLVTWSVPNWTKDERTINQKTPDLSNIIQEIVDMPNWNIENPITFIINGTGNRSAKSEYSIVDSLNQIKNGVPLLSIEYVSSCPYNLYVSTCNLASGEIYSAQNKLYSNEPIPGTVNDIEYIAGTLIEFDDNFEVNGNTNFLADIKFCY